METKIKGDQIHFVESLDLESNKIVNVATPTTSNDAANKQYVDDTITAMDAKASVVVASTANVNISSAPAAIDSVNLSSGNRVLLKNQTSGSANGIYVFNGEESAMTRATDANTSGKVTPGMFTYVESGTVNARTGWSLITTNITLGTTALVFEEFTVQAPITESNYVVREVPSGSINDSNTIFTLANSPVTNSEQIFMNGVLQQSGGADYSISGTTVTFVAAPSTGMRILANYLKN